MKTRLLFCFFAFALILCIKTAGAQTTYTWKGGSGTWNTAGNWTVGGSATLLYPGSLSPAVNNDVVIIPTSGSGLSTITYTGTHTIGSITTNGYNTNGIAIAFSGTTPSLTITNGMTIAQQNGVMVGLAFSGTGTASIGGTTSFGYQQSMSIGSGSTVNFTSSSTLDFTNNQGTLTNNGTLGLTSCTFKLGYNATLLSPGTIIATNSDFNVSNSSAFITYGGKFVSTSCTFEIPSGAYIKSTSTSSAFTSYTSTFSMTGSGGAAYFYNNGTFKDHGSTFNMSGQGAYLQNVASSIMALRGTTINFSGATGSNNQNIVNAGTLTIDSLSNINMATYTCYITNSGTFYAGTSGSQCVINITGQAGTVTNTTKGSFYLGPTSIIYPNSYQATINNTSPGTFTLQSDATGTASIGALTTTATCNGTFKAERFFQGSNTFDAVKNRWKARNYRIISPPLADTLATSNWGLNYIVGTTAGQTTAANSSTNTFITGCTGGSTTAGNPSIYVYRESITPSNATFTSGNFLGITNITNSTSAGTFTASDGNSYNLPIGNGVFFFFRGAAKSFATRTASPYIAPENVTLTSVGSINQQSVVVKDWYNSGSPNLGFSGSGTGTNFAVRGFNMVGNPYPCTIDWCSAYSGTGITRTNVNPTIYVFNPVTNQYDTFLATSASGGTATGNGSRYIESGQGFFIQGNLANPQLTFTEAAKAPTQQLTGSNLLMDTKAPQLAVSQALHLKLAIDTLNYDDIVLNFNSSASTKYNLNEDAAYLPGVNALEGLSSFSDDSVKLAINTLPLPKLAPQVVKLNVEARVEGTYSFQKMSLDAIPKIYEIWLMDNNRKDSLDLRNNSTYAFDVSFADTTSYGANRFKLVIRQNPQLMVHLLDFTGTKATDGAQIAWKTENEENYTYFTVERSSDGGNTFSAIGGATASAIGAYGLLDKNPPIATDLYRLKIEDLNGTISYSNVVTLMYANPTNNLVKTGILVYPNPAKTTLNLSISPGFNAGSATSLSYGIKIANILGSVVNESTTNQQTWQTRVDSLTPGTYVIQVVDKNSNSVVGQSTFIKL